MNQKQLIDDWLTKLYQAQEVALRPPCRCSNGSLNDPSENCRPEVCKAAAQLTCEAVEALAQNGFPRFVLSA